MIFIRLRRRQGRPFQSLRRWKDADYSVKRLRKSFLKKPSTIFLVAGSRASQVTVPYFARILQNLRVFPSLLKLRYS